MSTSTSTNTPRQTPPPAGFRISLRPGTPIPPSDQLGPPPCYEPDGRTPLYLASALLDNSIHPCKVGFHLSAATPAAVAYGGQEIRTGRYDLLPFVPEEMEFVRTSYGKIPVGRRPVEGGYEESGHKLYHAIASVLGVRIPGKTGEHLSGCLVGFGNEEHCIQENYEILCWKDTNASH
ncbi:hypothetical protein AX16_002424 [Volvariella volvacea WC 439]|nr:hypothetical protein AX16_002424 [Volvariella volvacea WC 439]